MNDYLTNLTLEEICHYGTLGDIPVMSIEDWKIMQEKIYSFEDECFKSGFNEGCMKKQQEYIWVNID